MKEAEVFYSWKHLACINYAGDLSGGFKLIELKEGFDHSLEKFQADYFIVFLLSGQLDILTKDSRCLSVGSGEMCLLTEGCQIKCLASAVLIGYASDHPGNNGSKLLKQLSNVYEKINGLSEPMKICSALESFLNLLKIYLVDGIACGHLQEQKQEELFALLEEYYTVFELGNLFSPILNDKDLEFKKLVNTNYLYASTVTELCDLCGFEIGEFRKKFQQVFGMPIYQWMQGQKVKKVKYRLQDLNVSYKELAYELGFASMSHLDKFCKQWLGMSPSKYQEGLKDEKECPLE